ncbi:MAG: DUF4337 family protein [Candidatus Binataceae bacterium]
MPEEPEVENAELEERHEEAEARRLLRAIALSTAILAALAAVAALYAGGTVNEALVLKTEATQLEAQASDQWADYQAKGIKGAIQAEIEAAWLAAGKQPPSVIAGERQRYAREQTQIARVAHEREAARDAKSEEAEHLLHQHHRFADSVALFQVAIALGAVAALTRISVVWVCSLLVGLGGAGLFFLTIF